MPEDCCRHDHCRPSRPAFHPLPWVVDTAVGALQHVGWSVPKHPAAGVLQRQLPPLPRVPVYLPVECDQVLNFHSLPAASYNIPRPRHRSLLRRLPPEAAVLLDGLPTMRPGAALSDALPRPVEQHPLSQSSPFDGSADRRT